LSAAKRSQTYKAIEVRKPGEFAEVKWAASGKAMNGLLTKVLDAHGGLERWQHGFLV